MHCNINKVKESLAICISPYMILISKVLRYSIF